jgi:hypothetical protein
MQPIYNGWVEPLPAFKYNVRLLVKEYQKYAAGLMTEIPADFTSNVVTQSFYHVISDSDRKAVLDKMPYTQTVIDELYETYHFNYVGYRCLLPRRSLSWHYDEGKMCYHIPLITNPGCWFVYEGKSFHMPADGSVYIVNNQSMHTFVNAGDEPRIHFTLKKLEISQPNSQ